MKTTEEHYQSGRTNPALFPFAKAGTPSALRETCDRIKKTFLKMYFAAGAGHVGSSLSCAEILTFVRFGWMGEDDECVLSKGHAAAALYATLAEAGDIDPALLDTFYQDGTALSGHPAPNQFASIRFATGSLGHGLSLAAGLALGMRLSQKPGKVFCITSDGELNEGSTWEAALFASHQRLSHLTWLIDRNRIQGFGRTEDVMGMEPLRDKLVAFGFHVLELDGHQFDSFFEARQLAEEMHKQSSTAKPCALICNTVKGLGMPNWESTVDSHYLPLKPEEFKTMVDNLDEE